MPLVRSTPLRSTWSPTPWRRRSCRSIGADQGWPLAARPVATAGQRAC